MDNKRRTDYKRAFNERAYDRLAITIPKGRKATVEARASELGESVNGYVGRLIRSDLGLSEESWKEGEKA